MKLIFLIRVEKWFSPCNTGFFHLSMINVTGSIDPAHCLESGVVIVLRNLMIMYQGLLKSAVFSILFLQAVSVSAQVAAVELRVKIPRDSKLTRGVFLAGSFNAWHAGDSLYRMKEAGDHWYALTIPVFDDMKYEYKYTLGSWDGVEVSERDSSISNRRFVSFNKKRITDTVIRWKQPKLPADSSAQLKKMAAMKDSLLLKLKPELEELQALLKPYLQNMLQENPDKNKQEQLDDQVIKNIGGMYRQIAGLFWNITATLSPEQKQQVLKAVNQTSNNDYINSFLNAVNAAVK